MKNKVVIVLNIEVSFAGEILKGEFIEGGIVFKQSDKSNIKMWIPTEEIKKIVFPDSTEISNKEIENVFERLEYISNKYNLEDII